MRRLLTCIFAAVCAWALPWVATAADSNEWPANTFAAICFHDIQDDLQIRPDSYSVSTRSLTVYLSWLHEHDYHVVKLDDVIESRKEGGKPLPPAPYSLPSTMAWSVPTRARSPCWKRFIFRQPSRSWAHGWSLKEPTTRSLTVTPRFAAVSS